MRGVNTGSSQRVVVLESLGMAGHMIQRYLSGLGTYEVIGLARTQDARFVDHQVDVENLGQPADALKAGQPAVVVNCVGVLNTAADDNSARAVFLNSYLPHWLARTGDELGFRLVHLSTDCVSSGATGGYTEASDPDGTTMYARTKALGEVSSSTHLTFRTSIVGPELKQNGSGLLEWFLRQTGPVAGYASVLWTGVTTLELAQAVHAVIEENLSGLYHLVPDRPISKYDLLHEIARAFDLRGVQIVPQGSPRCQRTLVCTRTDFSFHVHDYGTMLDELAAAIHDVPELRWHHLRLLQVHPGPLQGGKPLERVPRVGQTPPTGWLRGCCLSSCRRTGRSTASTASTFCLSASMGSETTMILLLATIALILMVVDARHGNQVPVGRALTHVWYSCGGNRV